MGEITGNGTAVTGLGGAAGYGETALARGDDTVAQVNLSAVFANGFVFGSTAYAADQVFISTDGLISFGSAVSGVKASPAAIAAPFFAIFNGDVDTRLDGEGPESGAVWLDVDTVNDCVTITWDHVGFYRRNATVTNTFQMQIFDRGNGFDVVYRYQGISWTSGDLQGGWDGLGGTAAMIGYRAAATGIGTLLGASGNETAELALPNVNGNTGVQGLWVFSFTSPSVITGTATADNLQGTSANDTIYGLGGTDVLQGSAGADLMDGGSGGADRVDYGSAPAAVRVDLAAMATNLGHAAGDVFVGIEQVWGSGFNDSLLGGTAGDSLAGQGGSDLLDGRAGNDSLAGGAGADTLLGHAGNDLLFGGTEHDHLSGGLGQDSLYGEAGNDRLLGQFGKDVLDGGDGRDSLLGGDGRDLITGGTGAGDLGDAIWGGAGRDTVHGNAGNDSLQGGSGGDRLWGDAGNDRLLGEAGNDLLQGGAGFDSMAGGDDNDTLYGDMGNDRLQGGAGADSFAQSAAAGQGRDWVLDFAHAEGDSLRFQGPAVTAADFRVTFGHEPGAGSATVREAYVTHLPSGKVLWVLVDGADEAAIMLHSSINSFDLL